MTIPTILAEAVKKFEQEFPHLHRRVQGHLMEYFSADTSRIHRFILSSLHSLIRAEIEELEGMKEEDVFGSQNRAELINSALTAVQDRLKSYLPEKI